MNEWMKSHKVHVYFQYFSFFQVWEDILKFDATAWNSYWSIYCASAMVET